MVNDFRLLLSRTILKMPMHTKSKENLSFSQQGVKNEIIVFLINEGLTDSVATVAKKYIFVLISSCLISVPTKFHFILL